MVGFDLPDMSGFEVVQALAKRPKFPALVMSSNSAADISKHADAAQLSGVLQKPVSRQSLYSTLENLHQTQSPKDVPDKVPSKTSVTKAENSRMKILTAEDNKTNQLVFKKMVKSLNIDLVFAANGEEAVELYKSYKPDLIFMDISMPKMPRGRYAPLKAYLKRILQLLPSQRMQ